MNLESFSGAAYSSIMPYMNTNTVIVGVLALVIGLGGGYFMAQGKQPAPMVHNIGSTMDSMTADLQGKSGDEFEKAFIDGMIIHLEGAVAMAQMVLDKSQRPELIKLAKDIIAAQTSEINMMKQWNATWFATSSTDAMHHAQ
jgi:hypothetical protein